MSMKRAEMPVDDSLDLMQRIAQNALRLGDKRCIDSVDQQKSISYGEFYRCCSQIANYLVEQGVGRGDIVSLIGSNSIEVLLIYFGTILSGAVISPINVDESEENISHILNFVRPKWVLHDVGVPAEACRVEGAAVASFSSFDEPEGRLPDDFFSAVQACSGHFEGPPPGEDDLAAVAFTSGTTSTPKGVCFTRRQLYLEGLELVDKLGMDGQDVLLEYRNYNWMSAQTLTILPSMIVGSTLVLAKKFSRSRFPRWLMEKDVTIAAGVPTVINILASDPVPLTKADVPRLRFMTSSSAPLSVERQRAFEACYGITILQMAGMSEAGFMLGSPPEAPRFGSAGTPCRYKDIFFVDDSDQRCPVGQQGHMVVTGPSIALGYLQADGSIERFPASGLRTGDLGHVDEDGYVYITGRAKDLIIRGGVNISPVEITNRVMTHPQVLDAATVGIPDPVYGEAVACFVVARGGDALSPQDVVAHCRGTLPDFKVPKRVFFVDRIPKNARGKVAKEGLMGLLAAAGDCGAAVNG
ncbi:MAG: class I adenylate-forming enzyme family protein [Deferrisomatales bacterium]|nr:class I adenylate-forming enzyme family protein [Deferrisomatales bacterium]